MYHSIGNFRVIGETTFCSDGNILCLLGNEHLGVPSINHWTTRVASEHLKCGQCT